jgi:hypothetical protein
MGLYFIYRALRGDLYHWVPLEGATGIVETVIERAIVKVLVDYTGVVHFRAAGEMGGIYFAFDMVRMRPLCYLLRPRSTPPTR